MKIAIFLAGFLAVAFSEVVQLSPKQREEATLALQNPNLYDGDMVVDYDPERNAINGNWYRWPNGVVPYVIDSSLSDAHDVINQGIDEYHKKTCVRFVPRTTEFNYVRIFKGAGCFANIGRTGIGPQQVSLGNGCLIIGTVVHELGHALGFWHEQNRSDRDEYVTVYLENVKDGWEYAFRKVAPSENILYNAFDYDSIMIYGNKAFNKNGNDTMRAKNGQKLTEPFDKSGLNNSDIERVKKMYNC